MSARLAEHPDSGREANREKRVLRRARQLRVEVTAVSGTYRVRGGFIGERAGLSLDQVVTALMDEDRLTHEYLDSVQEQSFNLSKSATDA